LHRCAFMRVCSSRASVWQYYLHRCAFMRVCSSRASVWQYYLHRCAFMWVCSSRASVWHYYLHRCAFMRVGSSRASVWQYFVASKSMAILLTQMCLHARLFVASKCMAILLTQMCLHASLFVASKCMATLLAHIHLPKILWILALNCATYKRRSLWPLYGIPRWTPSDFACVRLHTQGMAYPGSWTVTAYTVMTGCLVAGDNLTFILCFNFYDFNVEMRETGQRSRHSDWLLSGRPRGQKFSLLHVVQTGPGVHPTSYPMGTGCPFPGDKAAGAWSSPLTSN
jgi:hypothetical protein